MECSSKRRGITYICKRQKKTARPVHSCKTQITSTHGRWTWWQRTIQKNVLYCRKWTNKMFQRLRKMKKLEITLEELVTYAYASLRTSGVVSGLLIITGRSPVLVWQSLLLQNPLLKCMETIYTSFSIVTAGTETFLYFRRQVGNIIMSNGVHTELKQPPLSFSNNNLNPCSNNRWYCENKIANQGCC